MKRLIRKSSRDAKAWLTQPALMSLTSVQQISLRDSGLLICKQIAHCERFQFPQTSNPYPTPDISTFALIDQAEMLDVLNEMIQCRSFLEDANPRELQNWSEMFGAVALSYATENDLSVTAALIRTAVHLNLKHHWLLQATDFVLDQQCPDGSFGLISAEIHSQPNLFDSEAAELELRLHLTVESLWALNSALFLKD